MTEDLRTFIASLELAMPFTAESCGCPPTVPQVTWARLDKWPVVYLGCRDHIKGMVAAPIRAGVMPCTQEQFDVFIDEHFDEFVLKPYKEPL